MVVPTADAHVLLLAKNRARLNLVCRTWTTDYESLAGIVRKESLYRMARDAGLPVIPSIASADLGTIAEWATVNHAPYLIKPSYEGAVDSTLREKNKRLATRAALCEYLAEHGAGGLIIQRLLHGGDGAIFDCYGLCDKEGRAKVMASHRRVRQFPPDLGTTCLGEIPASGPVSLTARMFEYTERLLARTRYHGIFGIEWLLERQSGELYLIDFNARPFLTIGHLTDCGLNLPALAYFELIGAPLGPIDPRPTLRHLYWVDLFRDFGAVKRTEGKVGFVEHIASILRCRSFAYASTSDAGPSVSRAREIAGRAVHYGIDRARMLAFPGHRSSHSPEAMNGACSPAPITPQNLRHCVSAQAPRRIRSSFRP